MSVLGIKAVTLCYRPQVCTTCRVARTWGKAIVTDKWLQASAISGHCKDTAAYDLKPASEVDLPQSRSAFIQRCTHAAHLYNANLVTNTRPLQLW